MHKQQAPNRLLFLSLCIFLISSGISALSTTQLGAVTALLAAKASPEKVSIVSTPPGTEQPPVPPATTATEKPLPEILKRNTTEMVLMRDTFERPDQAYWGYSTNRIKWEGQGYDNPAFSIQGMRGIITGTDVNKEQNYSTHYQTAVMYDMEALLAGSLSTTEKNRLGTQVRRLDNNNWYGAYFDGKHLVIEKCVQGEQSILKSIPFPASSDRVYIMRIWAIQTFLAVKIWPQSAQEPAQWLTFTEDATHKKGYGGIYATLQPGSQAIISGYSTSGIYT